MTINPEEWAKKPLVYFNLIFESHTNVINHYNRYIQALLDDNILAWTDQGLLRKHTTQNSAGFARNQVCLVVSIIMQ